MADSSANAELVRSFYSAFSRRDHATMASLYSDAATFGDPVFPRLSAQQARAMWEMFCVQGKDLEVQYSDVVAEERAASAIWEARYTFGGTGRRVLNRIEARFEIADGKIEAHRDDFDFHGWAGQALGPVGSLLGWTPFFRNRVRARARRQLDRFMAGRTDPEDP